MNENKDIIKTIENFCQDVTEPFLNKYGSGEIPYPSDIIKQLSKLGLFGINIPHEFGGSNIPISANLEINRVLSKYWLSIPAMYGTHLRANQYLVEIGTQAQKETYLPQMAKGEFIFAHAFHEKGKKNPETFSTSLTFNNGGYFLSGDKEWVTNAENASHVIVVASRKDASGCAAIILGKETLGLEIVRNQSRVGIDGVSLNRISLNNIKVSPDQIIGGESFDASQFVANFRAISALNFAARCVGIAQSLESSVSNYLLPEQRGQDALPVIANRWSDLRMKVRSIEYYLQGATRDFKDGLLNRPNAHRAKIFCSATLMQVVDLARMLCGGSGYAGDDHMLIRQLRDAGSLALIDTPNDTLLTWSGLEDLREI